MDELDEQGERPLLRRFSRDLGIYSIASVVPALLGVVALVVFTRAFSPTAYGRYALSMAVTLVLSTVLFGWLQQSVLRFQTEIDRRALTANLLALLVLASTIGIVVGLVGFLALSPRLGAYEPFYLAILVAILARGAFVVLRALFQARLESARFTVYTVVKSGLTLGFALVLALVVFDSTVGWVWGAALATALTVAVMLHRLAETRTALSFDRSLCVRMFRFGAPLVAWLLGLTLLDFADRVLLEVLRGTAAVGVYSPNYSLVNRGLPLVLVPVIQTTHPLVMETWDGDNPDEVSALVTAFTRYYLIVAVPATVGVAVVSRPLSVALLGAEYRAGFVVIPIVALGLFFWYLAMLGHKGLEVRERTTSMALGMGIAVGLNVALNVPLITLYGYVGAAVASLVSFAVYPAFAYVVSRQSIPWRIPWRTVRNTTSGGVVMAIPGALLYWRGNVAGIEVVLLGGAGCVLYVVVVYLLGEFEQEELGIVKASVVAAKQWLR